MIGAEAIGMHMVGAPGSPFAPAVVDDLTQPGLEFTLPRRRMHFTLPDHVLHFTLVADDA